MKRSPLNTIRILLATALFLALEIPIAHAGGIGAAMACAAGVVIVTLIIASELTRGNPRSFFERHKKGSIVLATVAGCVLLISCCLQPTLAGDRHSLLSALFEAAEEYLAGDSLFSYYTAQLSLTFISISVMSVLSDKSVIIYWANVSEDRLIRPTFSCFAAYTYYSIGATVGSGLGVALNNTPMFLSFFAANVVVLILLTLSMVDVYYGRDTKKKKLAKTLVPHPNEKDYEDKILGLEQNLLRAADENDMTFLREVYELYINESDRFLYDVGMEAVKTIVSTLDAQTTGLFIRTLDRHTGDQLYRQPTKAELLANPDPLAIEKPAFDYPLWSFFLSDRSDDFLAQVSISEKGYTSLNAELFALTMMRRVALEYNYYAAFYVADRLKNGKDVDPDRYLLYVDPRDFQFDPYTLDGNRLSPEVFNEVYDFMAREVFHYRADFMNSILLLMNRIFRDGDNYMIARCFAAMPVLDFFYIDNLYEELAVCVEHLKPILEKTRNA